MGTTANGLPYPEGTDFVADGDNAIRALAEAIDPRVPAGGATSISRSGSGGVVSSAIVPIPGTRIDGLGPGRFLVIASGDVAWNVSGSVVVVFRISVSAGWWKSTSLTGGPNGGGSWVIVGTWDTQPTNMEIECFYTGSPGAGAINQTSPTLTVIPILPGSGTRAADEDVLAEWAELPPGEGPGADDIRVVV